MLSTMQDHELLVSDILRYGADVYGTQRVVTYTPDGCRTATFRDVAENAARLASALRDLGVEEGDRIGTLAWNTQEHLEAYFAVPAMGAVLHTLNMRLAADQLEFVVNQAEDRAILVDESLVPLLTSLLPKLLTVRHVIVITAGELPDLAGVGVVRYGDLLASGDPAFAWPRLAERSAAAMCYTSGTTGMPKGVVYSHRSTYLHSMAFCAANAMGLSDHDRVLPIVPMFHANAWGVPYASFLAGTELLLVGRHLQAPAVVEFIAAQRPTVAGAVPAILNDLLLEAVRTGADLSCLRMVFCGGAAVPRTMYEAFRDRYGVRVLQAWGMTETSPLVTTARIPHDTPADAEAEHALRAGRIIAGTEVRIVDDEGTVLPRDGVAVGEIEVRGPWITGRYYRVDAADKFHDGWLRTGDAGTIDASGAVTLTDRLKDVIKSGGEWISSVELENALLAHPAVADAAVIAVPDARWDERPLACVVLRPGATASATELRSFLAPRFASWWLPENWTFVAEVPKTSVGKKDKKRLRAQHGAHELAVAHLRAPGAA
jgi:fatty-acyl-CoA synthase